MVREALDRLELDMAPAVEFLFNRVATHPVLLASEFLIPKPLASVDGTLTPFKDDKCQSKGHFRTALLINNFKQIFITDESTLAIL